MSGYRKSGFTLAETLISLGIIAVILVFTVPSLISPNQDRQLAASVRESFTTIGEMYMARKQDPNYPPENIGVNERATFGQYLYDHLNYLSGVTPASVVDYCTTDPNKVFFMLHSGTVIQSICDISTVPRSLNVTFHIPNADNPATPTVYTLVIPEDTGGVSQNRYTTLYGFSGVSTNCQPDVDPILNTVAKCP